MRIESLAPRVVGQVVAEACDESGRLVSRRHFKNAYTTAYAELHAQVLSASATPSLELISVGLGCSGRTVSFCQDAAGWSSAPTVDATTFRQGASSFQGTATTSSSTTYMHATLLSIVYDATVDTHVEVWLRPLLRGRFDLTTSEVRIYTGSSASNYFKASLSAIETAIGQTLQDATWKLCRIPKASFSIGAGSPSWTTVSGAGFKVAANAVGTATLNIDDIRLWGSPIDTSSSAIYVPNEITRTGLSERAQNGTIVTATAYWPVGSACGQFYVAGLWGNGGLTLCSILPFDYQKAPGLSLKLIWTLTTTGG